MPVKQVIVELPDWMPEEEIRQRLDRLRWPSLTADQEKKRSQQVGVESELLGDLASQLSNLSTRLGNLEALFEMRSGPIAEELTAIKSTLEKLPEDLPHQLSRMKSRQTQQKHALDLRDGRIAELQKRVSQLEQP